MAVSIKIEGNLYNICDTVDPNQSRMRPCDEIIRIAWSPSADS